MRLLLVGAFSYPYHQGSQVYFQEQALALRAAGAEVELLTYGPPRSQPDPNEPVLGRALDGFVHHTLPASARPRSSFSGFQWGKLVADGFLIRTLNDAIALIKSSSASFDAVLAHNVEACVISSRSRSLRHSGRTPVIYCAHTLMQNELPAYYKLLSEKENSFDRGFLTRFSHRVMERAGRGLDQAALRGAQGWIALTRSSERVMRSSSAIPGRWIPPPIGEPERSALPDRTAEQPEPPYFLYSGNLDGYQEIPLIIAAARALKTTGRAPEVRTRIASFDRKVLSLGARVPEIEVKHVGSEAEMQDLIGRAQATLVPRRAVGGFPIKLANSLAQGTPAITFHDREWGLAHGREVWRADPQRPIEGLAEAMATLARDAARVARMREFARARFEAQHRPEIAAQRTLALIREVRAARPRR